MRRRVRARPSADHAVHRLAVVLVAAVGLSVSAAAAQVEPPPPPSDAVSLWSGNGDANDSRNGNHGRAVGAAGFAPGLFNAAFSLPGGPGDYFDFGNHPSLHLSAGDFSLSAWTRFDTVGRDMLVLSKGFPSIDGQVNADGWHLLKQADDRFWFCLGGDHTNGCTLTAPTTIRSQTVVTPGRWYHVATVKTSTDYSLYVDGLQEATRPLPAFKGEPKYSGWDRLGLGTGRDPRNR
jgi:hypothetical protein